ncbi:hypothetical protein SSBR45G_46710 [Bradyrhizobium sp. SSBR45G]|nr:hypothetical protein SSBR45G_46710 [Bradyrhizobium sp. SSBR45G]GLH87120.1 hypothetical protein SSBR45R_45800 [Bradyrhizobium sp. SSBR45R]
MSNPDLTESEKADLAERVHEAVEQFKRLRDSPLWNVQTFRVSDIAGELSRRQAKMAMQLDSYADEDPYRGGRPQDAGRTS